MVEYALRYFRTHPRPLPDLNLLLHILFLVGGGFALVCFELVAIPIILMRVLLEALVDRLLLPVRAQAWDYVRALRRQCSTTSPTPIPAIQPVREDESLFV